jgi:hypothetical protein
LFVTGRADFVTAADIGEKFREQIATAWAVPQMMVGSMIGRPGSMISSWRFSSQSWRTGAWIGKTAAGGVP